MERYHPSDPPLYTAHPAARAGLLVLAALVAAACTAHHRPATTAGDPNLPYARGTASWYGAKFNGRRTASGERYDMHALTAAHPTLPFGTLVAVTNLDNGRQVVVRINDRGPFKRQRVIDLSYAAARELDMIGPGSAEVQLAVVGRPDSPPPAPEPAPLLIAAASPPLTADGPGDDATAAPPGTGAPAAARGAAVGSMAQATGALAATPTAAVRSVAQTTGSPTAAPGAGADPEGAVPVAAAGEPRSAGAAPTTGGALQTWARGRVPGAEADLPAGDGGAIHYTVQVGAFGQLDRATTLEQRLAARYPEVAVHSDGTWHRVQIGAFDERDAAEALRRELAALGLAAIVVAAH